MRKSKRLALAVVTLLEVIFLVACSPIKTTHLIRDDGSQSNRISFHYQGDKLLKQTQTVTILYDTFDVKADEAKEAFDHLGEAYKNIEGVTLKTDYQDDRVVQTIEVDFAKVNLKENVDLLLLKPEADGQSVSYKKALKAYKNFGFKDVKDDKLQD